MQSIATIKLGRLLAIGATGFALGLYLQPMKHVEAEAVYPCEQDECRWATMCHDTGATNTGCDKISGGGPFCTTYDCETGLEP